MQLEQFEFRKGIRCTTVRVSFSITKIKCFALACCLKNDGLYSLFSLDIMLASALSQMLIGCGQKAQV